MDFTRALEQDLVAWKNRPGHLPLLLRGARQVGKTALVEQFAKKYYHSQAILNLEEQPELIACFDELNPHKILQQISAATGRPIIPGETLLFIDEIQEAPNAILALRYFKEKIGNLDVIGAGSLLDFVLNQTSFRMPVGRIEFLYLKPCSFEEFLWAMDAKPLWEAIVEANFTQPLSPLLHDKAMNYVHQYLILGGMPAALSQYLRTGQMHEAQRVQQHLWLTYQGDFRKYARTANLSALQTIFNKMPILLGQQTRYSKIDPEMRSALLKEAIHLLNEAGLVHSIYSTGASGIPLNTLINDKKYKLFFLDCGLITARTHLSAEILSQKNVHLVHQGALCEQFVAQELIAYHPSHLPSQLYYWVRDQKNSQAEIDFVLPYDQHIIPIEVKSGSSGWLKSLKLFMAEKNLPLGVRISERPLNIEPGLISIPLYMVFRLRDLLTGFL